MTDRRTVTRALLDSGIEQVGFASEENGLPRLEMMGGELCLNALLAYAGLVESKDAEILINDSSCIADASELRNEIRIALPFEAIEKGADLYVLFDTIGYCVSQDPLAAKNKTNLLKAATEKYQRPAFGYVHVGAWGIRPTVYVRGVGSLVDETACGSGSVAAYLYAFGANTGVVANIYQPSGQPITIKRLQGSKSTFQISAKVCEVGYTERQGEDYGTINPTL
ncbi:MAG: hypothetical protein WBO35_01860 [Candidatus Saccharimonadales bacterium]